MTCPVQCFNKKNECENREFEGCLFYKNLVSEKENLKRDLERFWSYCAKNLICENYWKMESCVKAQMEDRCLKRREQGLRLT